MLRTHTDALGWVEAGTDLLVPHLETLDEAACELPSGLPGWTRKHLLAHVAANADALRNLVHWAQTGEKTPMYSSMEQRNADIEAGAKRPASELSAWVVGSARDLAAGLGSLSADQWRHEVANAQGRPVPATEIPWMRAREVFVHAVDLATDLTFADLPEAFLAALVSEIKGKRELDELPTGPLADVAAWLAGRPHALADTLDLGAWL